MRTKFKLTNRVEDIETDRDGKVMPHSSIRLLFVPSPDDTEVHQVWSVGAPKGSMELVVTNPEAFALFDLGADYWFDISKVVP